MSLALPTASKCRLKCVFRFGKPVFCTRAFSSNKCVKCYIFKILFANIQVLKFYAIILPYIQVVYEKFNIVDDVITPFVIPF